MNKIKRSRGKFHLVTKIYIGLLAIGVGFICWALINIVQQQKYFDDAHHIPSIIPTIQDNILYPSYPVEGEAIGSLSIPVLKQELPIIQGTSENELKKGVGHFNKSVLPGEENNCVLSGHRDTVFSKIGELKIGDLLIVQTSAGTFTYKVNGTRIVNKDDKTVIVPTDMAVLTLTTCYPFNVFDLAPQERYILTANLVISE